MDLPSAYAATRFRSVDPPMGRLPDRFAVVTACNPSGQVASAGSNLRADEQLAAQLRQDGSPFWRVTGGDVDFSHAEPGYGVEASLERALALGRCFEQQAIFWVEQGSLFLVNCADGERVLLGAWQDRQDEKKPCPSDGKTAIVFR